MELHKILVYISVPPGGAADNILFLYKTVELFFSWICLVATFDKTFKYYKCKLFFLYFPTIQIQVIYLDW